jgi:hypothetical protein
MSLSVQIHTAFMNSFLATCREFRKNPQTLIREIISYLPRACNTSVCGGDALPIPTHPDTRFFLYRQGLEDAKSWTVKFQEVARGYGALLDVQWTQLQWFTVRTFAEFYLENMPNGRWRDMLISRATEFRRMSPAEIIAEADLNTNREIESLEREFLYRDPGTNEQGGFLVTQFNEEAAAELLGEGPSLDQGSSMTEHAQQAEQQEQEEQSEDEEERRRRIQEANTLADVERLIDYGENFIFNEVVADRQEGEGNYHITPQPSAKDSLKEIQSIIDEGVKDLIPEGTYLLLANKMKEAFNRS